MTYYNVAQIWGRKIEHAQIWASFTCYWVTRCDKLCSLSHQKQEKAIAFLWFAFGCHLACSLLQICLCGTCIAYAKRMPCCRFFWFGVTSENTTTIETSRGVVGPSPTAPKLCPVPFHTIAQHMHERSPQAGFSCFPELFMLCQIRLLTEPPRTSWRGRENVTENVTH